MKNIFLIKHKNYKILKSLIKVSLSKYKFYAFLEGLRAEQWCQYNDAMLAFQLL